MKKREYVWLGKMVHHYLEFNNYKLPEILAFINLNNRSIVEIDDEGSILDKLLDIILDKNNLKGFWHPCEPGNCEYAEKCYVKLYIDSFNDNDLGPVVRKRFKEIIFCPLSQKEKHITMRDIRSLISFVLFNKYTCKQLQRI